jgi:hypothetical protein
MKPIDAELDDRPSEGMTDRRPAGSPPNHRPSQWDQLMGSKALLLAVLFCATGAVGLPLLWRSPAFSLRQKWFWSVIVNLYTAILVGIVVWIALSTFRSINEALQR